MSRWPELEAGGKMMSDSGRTRASTRRAHARGVMGGSRLRLVAGVASVVLAGTGLAACTSAHAGTGPVTLNFYFYPDSSGATQHRHQQLQRAERRQVHDLLPGAARRPSDGQRQQLVRRLAAHDTTDGHPGPRRHLGGRVRPGRLDRAVDRHRTRRRPRTARWCRRCRPRCGRARCTRCRTTATPSCCGTAPTWSRPRPRRGPR